jgi:tetratricopeptide (TPR) repeat protein
MPMADSPKHANTSDAFICPDINAFGSFGSIFGPISVRYGEPPAPKPRMEDVRAEVDEGRELCKLGRFEDAIAIYDDMIGLFASFQDRELCTEINRALVSKSVALCALDRQNERLSVDDEIIGRSATVSELDLCWALVDKGMALRALRRFEDAIAPLNDAIGRYGASSEPFVCRQLALALTQKAGALRDVGRLYEAIAVYDEIISRFGMETVPQVRELVDRAAKLREMGFGDQASSMP